MIRKVSLLIWVLVSPVMLTAQNPLETYSEVQKMEDASVFKKLEWVPAGPSFQGGRIESIDCPPDQPGVIYAGFGSGSLWKTTDQGLHWACIFKDQATFSIGDIAVAPSNPEILYLGTGENLRATRGYTYTGTGIYKSVNGGKTWTQKGLPDSHHIGRVVVDPNDANLVFAACIGHMWSPNAERGLFLSRNGGDSWEKILHISDSVGIVDVVWDPVHKIIIAASWEMIQGQRSAIFRSENYGATWEKCESGFPVNEGIGRIGLSISPSHPNVVYAVIDNRNTLKTGGDEKLIGAEVYRSDDSGKTWKRTHSTSLDIYSGFGWAFGDIRVSPHDRNKVYVLGVHTLQSHDGGKTFTKLGGQVTHLIPNKGTALHLDNHDLYLDPFNPENLILGNDGGIYISHDGGRNWLHCNNIPTGEFYDLIVDNRPEVPVAYGGTQDNSCIKGPLNSVVPGSAPEGWEYVWLDPWSGGDGFTSMPDPTDPDLCYYTSQNGNLNKKNIRTGETRFIQPSSEAGESPIRTSWFTPWFISKHNPTSLYYGANKVYHSIDRGDNWFRLSPDLCYSEDPFRKSRAMTALAESPVKSGLLYAGTEKGALWVSRDDGINWIEISNDLPIKSVCCIMPSVHEEGRVYLAMRALDEDDYKPYLYISENKGVNWKSISRGLPVDRVNYILEDPVMQDLIYIGTDRGVFVSANRGNTWTSLSATLPTASVQKLAWAGDNGFLVAATHGLSLFTLFAEPVRRFYKSIAPGEAGFLALKSGKLPAQKDFQGDLNWLTSADSEVYWYQPTAGSMVIILTDQKDKEIFSTRFEAETGINRWSWNHVISFKEDTGLYPMPEIKFPAPGDYLLTIQGQGTIVKADLNIR